MTPITDKLAAKWRIEYDNECWPDGEGGSTFEEWWSVTDGRISFKCEYQDDAQMLLAALAAYTSQQAEPSDARVEAYTSEKHFALRGAYCIAAGDAYFEARPFAPGDPRITFDAGFVRGFDKATELADARAVLQAADAVSAGAGWQPIDTAPKDGTHVLVVTVNNMVMTARWSSHRCRWLVAYDKNYSATSDHDPTHWQPLPAPPSIGAEGQEG